MYCYKNLNQIITLSSAHKKNGRKLIPEDLSIIEGAAIVFDESKILWVGKTDNIPDDYKSFKSYDLKGHTLLPEIVDSHTHLVFSGNRSKEYIARLNGADYEEIAKMGGGILATMDATKNASFDELFSQAVKRIERINNFGIGTIEIKSGYGLTLESEERISEVIHKLKEHFCGKVQILNTFLAAHAIPKEYKSSKEYMEKTVLPLLDKLASKKIIDFVDIFHEQGYFSTEDVYLLAERAKKLNIPLKMHADEFNDNKGAKIACELNAISCDHLLATTEDGIESLSKANTVATLLPGTALFLGKPLADAQAFFKAGAKVAIASDYNPGSCHCDNLLLLTSICAKNLKLNSAQMISAITLNSAHALNLQSQGAIIEGLKPRFSLFKANSYEEIFYNWGKNLAISLPHQ